MALGVSRTAAPLALMVICSQQTCFEPAVGSVHLEVTHASRLGWSTEEGIRKGQIELRVYCGDAKEAIIGDFSEHLDLQANEETHAQWLQTGVHRSIRVPINGVPKYVKVVVYDYGTDRVGSYMLTLKDKK